MKVTVRYWRRLASFEPDYKKQETKTFEADTAAECMRQLDRYRDYHDLAEYTPPEIINVED